MATFVEFQELSAANDKVANFLKKKVTKIYKQITKAAKRGRYSVEVSYSQWRSRPIGNHELREILVKHFENCGYNTAEYGVNYCLKISWRPQNYLSKMQICTPEDKLKQLILTGTIPKVLIGDEDRK